MSRNSSKLPIHKLAKLVGINYYNNAIALLGYPIVVNGICKSVEYVEESKDIFSTSKLIDGKYYIKRTYEIDGNGKCIETKYSIDLIDENEIKKLVISKFIKKLNKNFDKVEINSYKIKNNKFVHVMHIYSNFINYNDYEKGDSYDESMINLLFRASKYINSRKKYDSNKGS